MILTFIIVGLGENMKTLESDLVRVFGMLLNAKIETTSSNVFFRVKHFCLSW